MRIALIGYGKMGHAIEEIAIAKGHEIVLKIDATNTSDLNKENLSKADVAIEFTGPETAVNNILKCFDAGTPVVCGSTGWMDKLKAVEDYCKGKNGGFLYASNFSIGVNLFFELNKQLAKLMNAYTEYDVTIHEVHHTQKKDAPSGTAITLAEQLIENLKRKNSWVKDAASNANELAITSERTDPAPGTHVIKYFSDIDDIEIIHTAHNRKGFAAGAVLAAEFLKGKKGIYSMNQVLGL